MSCPILLGGAIFVGAGMCLCMCLHVFVCKCGCYVRVRSCGYTVHERTLSSLGWDRHSINYVIAKTNNLILKYVVGP